MTATVENRRAAAARARRAMAEKQAIRRAAAGRFLPKPALTAFTHNPALLAACRDELAAWSARQLDPLRRLRRGNHIGARRSA